MNQQIRQLAEQAGLISPQDDRENWQEYINDVEKFAESLIRKCAGVCLEQRQYQTKEVYAQAVLSHFGVEE